MTHAEMDELYELYVLGVLEPDLALEIDRHLADQCATCAARIQEALAITASLATTAPLKQPPAALRDRVLSSIPSSRKIIAMPAPQQSPKKQNAGLLGLSAACAALLVGCIWLGYQNGEIRRELAAVNRDRAELEAVIKGLSRSETKAVQFGKADQPHGRVFVNGNRGVVFVASSLPKLPIDRTFQLWVIPPAGNPQSAGIFRSDAEGNSVQVSQVNVQPGSKAVAVSIEPQSGSTAPTTTPIIVVPIGD